MCISQIAAAHPAPVRMNELSRSEFRRLQDLPDEV